MPRLTLNLCLATWLLALVPAMQAQAASVPDFSPLDTAIRAFKQDSALPTGTAVVVLKDGKVVFEAYYGEADLQHGTPVDARTLFYIASATKPMFALDMQLAAREGRIAANPSLQAMFPGVAFRGLDADRIHLRDLLVHTSGIDNAGLGWATAFSGVHDTGTLRALVAQSQPNPDAPTGRFDYTNLGYNIASVWLDRVDGRPWQDSLQARVFGPLGMRHTTARASEAQARGWPVALPHSAGSATPSTPLTLRKTDATMHAAGGVLSTAPDLARFLQAELAAARGDATPVPNDVLRASQQRQVATEDRYLDFARDGYAWGWYTGTYKGQSMRHHFGSFAGFHAHLSFMPEAGVGLVVLNNEDVLSARLTAAIADAAYGIALGDPAADAAIAPRFAALRADAGKLREAVSRQREKLAARQWRLSLSRDAYAGRYRHPLLGTVQVRLLDGGVLAFDWGVLQAVATAYDDPDTARVEFVPGSGQVVAFEVADGHASAITFDGLRFARID